MTDKKISAVIACYLDEPAISLMYERLTRTFTQVTPNYEMVFVNDGSPDNSEAILTALAGRDPRVVVITHTRNFSSQNAFLSGMHVATGDAVVLLDGDLQDPPELIPQLVERWLAGYEVVYGVRVKREASLFLRAAYKLFYRILQKLAYVRIPLDAGDFSLLDRRVVETLKDLGERDIFLRGLRAWIGFRQTGVPYVRPARMFGRTTNSLIKNVRWARKAIFAFSFAPLEWVSYVAGLVTILAAIGIVVYIVLAIFYPAPRGFLTLLVVSLFLGSVQLLALSVIGEYVAKIFEEVKGRPHYIVRSILNDPRGK